MLELAALERLIEARNMRELFDLRGGYPIRGDYLAYQYVIDLNYGKITDFTEKALERNNSYLIFRKLQLNVGGFRRYLRDNSIDSAERDLLAAKFVGRWPSGTPLTLAPDHDDLRLAGAPQNNFGFIDTDPEGYRCPV